MTNIVINGETRELAEGTTVTDVVSSLTKSTDGCAVAINDAVVPRSIWSTRALQPGDRIEVLTAVQGG